MQGFILVMNMKKICEYCGKEFENTTGKRKYCSHECASKARRCCDYPIKIKQSLRHAWRNMKNRCTNPNVDAYKNYGGRGITICEEWFKSFPNFCEWAVKNGYESGLTLDRIDVEGNYCPENCRWVDRKTQGRNKRGVKVLTFRGESLSVPDWADRLGIPSRTINQRLNSGWSIEKALTTPKLKSKNSFSTVSFVSPKKYESMTYQKICKVCGNTFYSNRKNAVYCCRECLYESRRRKNTKTCLVCGKEFIPKFKKQKYCSHECSSVAQQSIIDLYGNKKVLYSRWQNMKERCYNLKNKHYQDYGARGITVCEEWKNSFKNFYEWANTHGFSKELSLDRVDVNKGYSPKNCRWVCAKVQSDNKRNNRFIIYKGVSMTIGRWASRVNLTWDILAWRLQKGWDIEKALFTPRMKTAYTTMDGRRIEDIDIEQEKRKYGF